MLHRPSPPRWPPMEARRERFKYAPVAYRLGRPLVPELEGKRFYHFNFPALTIAARGVGEALITTDREFWMVGILGQATQVIANTGSFRIQLLDQGIRTDRWDRHFFQNKAVDAASGVQIMTDPNWMIRPHRVPASHPIALRINNLATVANVVNISVFGYVNAPLASHVEDGGLPQKPATDRNLPPNLRVL